MTTHPKILKAFVVMLLDTIWCSFFDWVKSHAEHRNRRDCQLCEFAHRIMVEAQHPDGGLALEKWQEAWFHTTHPEVIR